MLTSTLIVLICIIIFLFGTTVISVAMLIKLEPIHKGINDRLDAGESLEEINKSLGRA